MYFKCSTRLSLASSAMVGQHKPGTPCLRLHILGSKARSEAPNPIFCASVWSLETMFLDSGEERVQAGIPVVMIWNSGEEWIQAEIPVAIL